MTDILVEETNESQSHTKTPRAEFVVALVERDGLVCAFPECSQPLDLGVKEGPMETTIDHWMPQHYGKANGWSWEQIWDLDNLKLMHKKCNAKKGDRIPNKDGTLPPRPVSTFRHRRAKRAERAELCMACDNGHNLGPDEVCSSCGCNAQRYPRWAKVTFGECDHAAFWCWVCSITPDMRVGATEMIMLHGEGGN